MRVAADAVGDSASCVFCEIVSGRQAASIVFSDALVVALMDLRQFHPGHVLVVPRTHVNDIRAADVATAHAVIDAVVRITRAVNSVFPNDGISVWHSIGPGANQEVPHLHFHVHPRHLGDEMFRAYPSPPSHPSRDTLDQWAQQLKATLTPNKSQ